MTETINQLLFKLWQIFGRQAFTGRLIKRVFGDLLLKPTKGKCFYSLSVCWIVQFLGLFVAYNFNLSQSYFNKCKYSVLKKAFKSKIALLVKQKFITKSFAWFNSKTLLLDLAPLKLVFKIIFPLLEYLSPERVSRFFCCCHFEVCNRNPSVSISRIKSTKRVWRLFNESHLQNRSKHYR